jgi:hypothetical protein
MFYFSILFSLFSHHIQLSITCFHSIIFTFHVQLNVNVKTETRKLHNILNVRAARFVAFFSFFLVDGSRLSPIHVLHESLNSRPLLNKSF